MGPIDPEKFANVFERYFQGWFARFLIRFLLISVALGVSGAALFVFFDWFVAGLVWPFFSRTFGVDVGGITLDNIEAVVMTLVAAIVVLVLVFIIVAIILARAFRRRVVPQSVIDELGEYRSKGISVLNDNPTDSANVPRWEADWKAWAADVTSYLEINFTKAERLMFHRLGVVPPVNFGQLAFDNTHAHYLMLLAKQLNVLEILIDRHQERR